MPSQSRCGQFATRRDVIAAHEPAIQAIVEWFSRLFLMIQSNCWWAWCVESAEKTAAVVLGILGRVSQDGRRSCTRRTFAVADRRTAVPVEAVVGAEIRREAVIDAEHDVPRIQLQRLVSDPTRPRCWQFLHGPAGPSAE